MGFRRFHVRGLEAVNGEWTLTCLAWNLKTLMGCRGPFTGSFELGARCATKRAQIASQHLERSRQIVPLCFRHFQSAKSD